MHHRPLAEADRDGGWLSEKLGVGVYSGRPGERAWFPELWERAGWTLHKGPGFLHTRSGGTVPVGARAAVWQDKQADLLVSAG